MKKSEQKNTEVSDDIRKIPESVVNRLIEMMNSDIEIREKYREKIIPNKKNTVKSGLKKGETRATFILNESKIEKIKAIAFWDRVPLKVVMEDVLNLFIDSYEKRNGTIKKVE